MRTYNALLKYLFTLRSGSASVKKEGLRNSLLLDQKLGRLGLEQYNPRNENKTISVIHVAGTNGKGSVCWKVAKACETKGLRTGLFTSPHIVTFRSVITIFITGSVQFRNL